MKELLRLPCKLCPVFPSLVDSLGGWELVKAIGTLEPLEGVGSSFSDGM